MCDTKLISLRIPSSLLEAVDEVAKVEGRSRANVIVRAIQAGMVLPRNQEPITRSKAEKMIIARDPKPRVRETESAREVESPKATETAGRCPEHGVGCGFPKAGGWWCSEKSRIV